MNTRFYLPVLPAMLLIAIAITGCASKTSDRDIVLVGADQAESLQSRDALLLDPRLSADWRAGHLPGAVHVPYEELRNRRDDLKGYRAIVVYGSGYRSPVAMAASKTLQEMGFKNVRVLEGGIRAWESSGRMLETTP